MRSKFKLPTSRSNPELFDAKIVVDPTKNVSVRPFKKLNFDIKLTNTGKAAWLDGHASEDGSIYLVMNWYRNDRLLARFSARRKLRYQVLPGKFTRYFVDFNVPRNEGFYNLNIGVNLVDSRSQNKRISIMIPVQVTNY
jgi:hypothetical protein